MFLTPDISGSIDPIKKLGLWAPLPSPILAWSWGVGTIRIPSRRYSRSFSKKKKRKCWHLHELSEIVISEDIDVRKSRPVARWRAYIVDYNPWYFEQSKKTLDMVIIAFKSLIFDESHASRGFESFSCLVQSEKLDDRSELSKAPISCLVLRGWHYSVLWQELDVLKQPHFYPIGNSLLFGHKNSHISRCRALPEEIYSGDWSPIYPLEDVLSNIPTCVSGPGLKTYDAKAKPFQTPSQFSFNIFS